ncbi:MAG: GTP cyclohydrolase III [Halobacteriaceae archaeon]
MPATQLTLIQIDNYGPWTVSPTPRREADLQTMQSRLYADLSQFIGHRGGYVFFTRFDNMIAVTNGLTMADHDRLQTSIRNRYPVTISLAVAAAQSPVDALERASDALQAAGSAQDATRREILRGDPLEGDGEVQLAHFDVVDATERFTDRLNAFDSFVHIEDGYATLMAYLRRTHEGLAFFVGGDNIIAVCPHLDGEAFEDVIDHVEAATEVELKVGVGHGPTAEAAGMDAKHALEVCRDHDTRIEGVPTVAHDD